MATKKQNTMIGRRCLIDFACRWKDARPEFQASLKADYETRDDWNATGGIVDWNATDHRVWILRDDTKRIQDYYAGEVTITGPAANPEAETIALLTEIRDLLKAAAAC